MTRLTETLNNLKTCRRMNPNRRNYPVYRQLLPAKLNDTVKGRVEKTAGNRTDHWKVLMDFLS